jgi:hypothetical protein
VLKSCACFTAPVILARSLRSKQCRGTDKDSDADGMELRGGEPLAEENASDQAVKYIAQIVPFISSFPREEMLRLVVRQCSIRLPSLKEKTPQLPAGVRFFIHPYVTRVG